jgi:hypothetical protein
VVSNKEDDEAFFLDQEHAGLFNNKVWESMSVTSTYPKLLIQIKTH